jgi:hypothetical protein
MQSLSRWAATLGLAAASAAPCATPAPPPPLPAEHLTVEKLPARSPHWVYVVDYAFANEIDGRVRLYDGDTHRRLGQVGSIPDSISRPTVRRSS